MKTKCIHPIKAPYESPFVRERSFTEIRPLCYSPTGGNEVYIEEEIDW